MVMTFSLPSLQRILVVLTQAGLLLPFMVISDCDGDNRKVLTGLEFYQYYGETTLTLLGAQALLAALLLWRPGTRTAPPASAPPQQPSTTPADPWTAWSTGIRGFFCTLIAIPIGLSALATALKDWGEVWSGTLLHGGGWCALASILVLVAVPAGLRCVRAGPRDRLLLWGYFAGVILGLTTLNVMMHQDDDFTWLYALALLLSAISLAPAICGHGALTTNTRRRACLGLVVLLWNVCCLLPIIGYLLQA